MEKNFVLLNVDNKYWTVCIKIINNKNINKVKTDLEFQEFPKMARLSRDITMKLNTTQKRSIAYNGLRIRDVALIRMLKSRHKAQCAIYFIRCYVLSGLSALNLILKRNGNYN